ncbi:MAG: helix-turn-helix transcriptional regulator [Rhodospirillales bacterium]|nr:helix-turn-helix transcriptional regulator [Rhodospirillales bacterium]
MTPLDSFLSELNKTADEKQAWACALRFLECLGIQRPENDLADWFNRAAEWTWESEAPALREENELALRIAAHYLRCHLSGLERHAACEAVHLTPRESQALACVAQGLNSKAAARIMGSMPKTVDLHIDNARKKLGAATRVEAVAKALKLGAISLSP